MILVDVEVPVMGKTYDVQIDETVPVKEIAGQIRDMICLQEQCGILGGQENLTLWDVQRQQCLMGEHTAKEYEITTGQGLCWYKHGYWSENRVIRQRCVTKIEISDRITLTTTKRKK